MNHLSEKIRVVLVETSHPGNIGAVARAMKTMGLHRLYLVNPRLFPDEEATARATHAEEILQQAVVVESFDEAIADCQLILGTSARPRSVAWPSCDARHAAEIIVQASEQQIAIVFGRERIGLVNEELQRCHWQIQIPSNPVYSSLNLAAAVQIVAYEIFVANMTAIEKPAEEIEEIVTDAQLQGLYQHMEQVLYDSEFLKQEQPKQVMQQLRRVYNRARLTPTELNILRGMLTAVQKKISAC